MLEKLRIVASSALVGCAVAGALFGWAHFQFDVHVPGAVIGAAIGVLFVMYKF